MNYNNLKERIEKIEKEANKIIPNRSYNIVDMTKFEDYLVRNAGVDPDAGNRREDFKENIKPQLESLKEDSIKMTSRLEVFESQAGDLDFTSEKREKYNEIVVVQAIANAYTGGLSHIATNLMKSYEERQEILKEVEEVSKELKDINDKIFINERVVGTHDGSDELIAKRDELLEKLNNTQDGLLTRLNRKTTEINKIIRENNLNKRKCLLANEDLKHAIKYRELEEEKEKEKEDEIKPEDEIPEEPTDEIDTINPGDEIDPEKEKEKEPENTKEPEEKKKGRLKVVSSKVWDWAKKHPKLATIALGLALTSSVPIVSSGLMMINSSLWAAIGGKGALAGILHSINLGLSKVAGLGMFSYNAAAGTYNLAGLAGSRLLYSAVGAKLTTAALAFGAIGKKIATKIKIYKEKKEGKEIEEKPVDMIIDEKEPEMVDEESIKIDPTGIPAPEEEEENKFKPAGELEPEKEIEVKPEEIVSVDDEKPVVEEVKEEKVSMTKEELANFIKEQVEAATKPLLEEIERLKQQLEENKSNERTM